MFKEPSGKQNPTADELAELRRQVAELKTALAGQSVELDRLRSGESEFRSLFMDCMEGMILVDGDGNILNANPSACRMLGSSETDLRRLGRRSIIDTSAPLIQAALAEKERTGKFQGELTYHRKDGSTFPVDVSIKLLPDTGGRSIYHLVFRDISERVNHELALQDERVKLMKVFNLLPTGISVLDKDGNIISHNPALEKILGFTAEDLGAHAYTNRKYIKPDGTPAPPEYFPSSRVMAGESPADNVVIGVCREDGSTVWTEVSAVACNLPDWKVILSTSDITKHVLLEQELVENEQKYRAQFENSLYAGAIVDMESHIILDINESFTRLFGFSREEVVGKLTICNFSAEPEATGRAMHELAINGSYLVPVHRMVRKDGIKIYTSIAGSLYTWKGKRVVSSIFNDITQRLEAENALRESEEKYRVIFDNDIYAICIYDLETFRFLDANEAFTKLYGYSHGELLAGMTIMDVSAEPEKSITATRLAEKAGSLSIPLRYHRKKDGTVFAVESSGVVSTWKERGVMFAIIHDITIRKDAEDALRENEEKYRVLFNNDFYPACIYDPLSLRFIDANGPFLRLYGYTREELLNSVTLPDLSAEPDQTLVTIKQGIISGQYNVAARRHRKKDGTIFTVETVGELYTWKKKKVIFGLVHDITSRVESEKKIAFQAALLENAGEAVAATDAEGRIIYWNKAAERISGFSKYEVIGKIDYDVLIPLSRSVSREEMGAMLSAGETVRLEMQARSKTGQIFDLFLSSTPIMPGNQEPPYVITVIQDITERKRMQEQILEARKMAGIGTIAAGLAHELNSPLQVITGTCEIALNRLESGRMDLEQAREKLDNINRSAWNCAAILSNLLEEAGPTGDTTTVEDINALIEEAVPFLLRLNTPARQYSARTWPGSGLPALVCKRGKVLQLLYILLQNAADAMPDGGKVTIRSGCQPLTGEVWMQLSDRGHGVPAELRMRIFEPFFTTRPQGSGRGLGLYIFHNTLTAMGGRVEVGDAEPNGASFTVYLPTESGQSSMIDDSPAGRYDHRRPGRDLKK